MSKFPLEVLRKKVYPFTLGKHTDPGVVLGSTFGEDVAVTRVGGDLLLSHVDPIVGAVKGIGWLAVHVACNDIAASGIKPRWIQLLVLVASAKEVDQVERIMSDAARAAESLGVTIIGGHTGYSAALERPLVAVTALAPAEGRRVVTTGGARPGDLIYVTRGIGLEGTGILASDFAEEALSRGLEQRDIQDALKLLESVSVVPEALELSDLGATAMHDVTRGGVLETFLEIGSCSGVCMDIDASALPVPPVVNRFAEAFGFDPLKMISSGTLAVTLPPESVEEAEKCFARGLCDLKQVGVATEGEGVRLREKDKDRLFTEMACEEDELARMWELLVPEGKRA
ncbi:MAG: AIR synthase-related protein [Thermovirgaceae bacterium]